MIFRKHFGPIVSPEEFRSPKKMEDMIARFDNFKQRLLQNIDAEGIPLKAITKTWLVDLYMGFCIQNGGISIYSPKKTENQPAK